MSSAQKSEVKAWEEEIVPCTHTTNLVQPHAKKLEPSGPSHVSGSAVLVRKLIGLAPRQDSPHARTPGVD